MAKFNLKQVQEEHKNELEILQLSHKFALKMTTLITSAIFCMVITLCIFFGATTTGMGIGITIGLAILFAIIAGTITRSACV